MKETIGVIILAVFLTLGASWLFTGNDFFLYKVFAPKRAEVDREVFQNTPSYTRGMVQDLAKLSDEYRTSDPTGRAMICADVRHRFADFPESQIPNYLQPFVRACGR
jgi:hypothetical protein